VNIQSSNDSVLSNLGEKTPISGVIKKTSLIEDNSNSAPPLTLPNPKGGRVREGIGGRQKYFLNDWLV
jgi:hypothetical protein